MDRFGNVVGLTQSIERVFGSCCASEELGFLYNNYLMAYEYKDMKHPYYLRPVAVPWASVAPTILLQNNKPILVIGSPGSERITASILQVLLRLRKQSPLEAVDAPRFYCSFAGKVSLEASRMRSDIVDNFEEQGFDVDIRDPYSFYMGCVQLVIKEDESFIGVADPRRDGSVGGPKV
jgi:gamma-glutamyltranspeptidase/glutathione hydrolase